MASKALKGLTVKIGGDTSELLNSLKSVEQKSKSLSGELGQINKLLKLDPKNTDLLAQKQQVLAEAISSTEEKLKTLREAQAQAQEQFENGDITEEQYRALQREIIATEGKLKKYRKAVEETEDEIKSLGDESGKTGDDIDDLGDKTKETGDDIEELGDESEDAGGKVSGLGDTLEKGLAVGLGAVAAAAIGAAAGIKSVVEETVEYRNAMGKLDTAFTQSGHTSKAATATYKELQSVLGETDQSVEAAAFIAKLTDNEADLATWTNIATGVYGQFGASLPIEGLTEAANETAKVGQVTGPLADALNWAAKEGETFGVTLKENIDFTELSVKEMERLTEAQLEEYEAQKTQHEEIEAYNQSVKEAASAEDLFNIALSECTTEQERQKLIMETLNSMYADAADHFRETNEEVIKQNEANERLNDVWAKIGDKAAPIVTTFTEGVAELVEAFWELIKDVDLEPFLKDMRDGFQKITKNVLPKLIDALKWCAENFDILKSVAMGFIAALAVAKISSFAMAVAGPLVSALVSATAKQHLMNAAAAANPYVLLAAAIIAVATAIGTYYCTQLDEAKEAAYDAAKETYGLTEAEEQLVERAQEVGDAFRSQRNAMDSTISSIQSQFGYLGTLRSELQTLADAQGNVAEKDQARAQFILTELNNALGTEYQLLDGQIQQYGELSESIDEVIQKKKLELLLDAGGAAYAEAIRGKQQVEADYYQTLIDYTETLTQIERLNAEAAQLNQEKEEAFWVWELNAINEKIAAHNGEYEAIKETLDQQREAYQNNKTALEGYYNDIGQYETAQLLALEGNTAEAERIMSDRAYYMEKYATSVGFESDQIMNSYELQATTMGIQAETMKKNWEDGIAGYTESMVTEANEGYNAAVAAMDSAYEDAYGVGYDITDGITDGMESGQGALLRKIRSIISSALAAAEEEAARYPLSGSTGSTTSNAGQSVNAGLNAVVSRAGTVDNQAQRVLAAYDNIRASDGQYAIRQLESQETANLIANQASVAATNSSLLGQILDAVKEGHIILLDGNVVAGGTANKMDRNLGLLRMLSARGAR